jgi:hypothetical protein
MADLSNTNAQLAAQMSALLNRTDSHMDMQFDVLGTPPDGGEFANGYVLVHNAVGMSSYQPSWPTLVAEFRNPVANAIEAYDLANSTVQKAAGHAANSANSAGAALASETLAHIWSDKAAGHSANALDHATVAEGYRDELQVQIGVLHQGVSDLGNAVTYQAELTNTVQFAQSVVTTAEAKVQAANSNINAANTNINGLAQTVASQTASVLAANATVANNTSLAEGYMTDALDARDATFTARNVAQSAANTAVAANVSIQAANSNVNAKEAADTLIVIAAEASVSSNAAQVADQTAVVTGHAANVATLAGQVSDDASAVSTANAAIHAVETVVLTARDDVDADRTLAEQAANVALAAAANAQSIVGGDFVFNAERGVANGVATLGPDGKVPTEQIGLDANNVVTSVSGRTGDVTLTKADVGLDRIGIPTSLGVGGLVANNSSNTQVLELTGNGFGGINLKGRIGGAMNYALTYSPAYGLQVYDANGVGSSVLTSITSNAVTGALGYTPANRAGADFGILGVSGNAGAARELVFKTGTDYRWNILTSGEPESGGDKGSNLGIARYSDAGTWIDTPVSISRETGEVSFNSPPKVFGQVMGYRGIPQVNAPLSFLNIIPHLHSAE